MHRDRFGDVLENHRPHVLVTVLEERRLALDDGAGDLHEGFVADLQAFQQPARLLQLRAHARMAGVAPDEAGVALIEPHAWQRRRVDLHAPAVLGAAHEHIRHHVLRAAGAHGGPGVRMAGAHQGKRRGEFLLGGAQLAAQQRQLALGDQLEVLARDLQRGAQARRSRIQLPQLQLDALGYRTRADARRVEGLYPAEHTVHFFRRALELRAQRVRDFRERFGEIAVVADGIDDGARHREIPRCQAGELQLPHQVILQRLTAGVGVFLLALVLVAAPGGFGRSHAVLAPAVVEHFDRALRGALRGPGLLGGGHQHLERAGALGLVGLEHHVRLQQLADVRLELERRQLEEPDRLLQLRGHGQLLTQLQLQRGFQHGDLRRAGDRPSRFIS